MKYAIATYNKLADLTRLVNELLADGWQCQGGISTVARADKYCVDYLQAMVKDELKTETLAVIRNRKKKASV